MTDAPPARGPLRAPSRPPSLRRQLLAWLVLLHLLAIVATAWAAYEIYGRAIESLREEFAGLPVPHFLEHDDLGRECVQNGSDLANILRFHGWF